MASNSSGALAREKPETQGKWISITGKPLELDVADGFLGRCLDISQFEKLNQLGEGTYGVVYRASDTKTSRIVALKQVRIPIDERQNGIPITALREMSILRSLKHANIVNVFDVAASATVLDEVYMVMEYAEQVGLSFSMASLSWYVLRAAPIRGVNYG
ncbi:Cdc2- kinase [Agyrium rufum]|nr:Cdc2- kinase [Agyrium rufum]